MDSLGPSVRERASGASLRTAEPAPPARARGQTPWYAWALGGCLTLALVLAVGCAGIGGVLFGLARHAPQQVTASGEMSQQFAVTGPVTLTVDNPTGDVEVIAGPDKQVVVTAEMQAQAQSATSAQTLLDSFTVSMRQTGDTIAVETRLLATKLIAPGTSWGARITVTLPTHADLRLEVGAGDVTLGQLTGSVVAHTRSGRIHAVATTIAGHSELTTASGAVTIDGFVADGASLLVKVGAGDVSLRLPLATSAHLDARAEVGDITIVGWPLPITREHGSGARTIGDLSPNPQASVTIQVAAGDVRIEGR